MSLYEFKTIQRFDNKTIADSKAELSESEEYILWTEDKTTQRGTEIHLQRLNEDYIPLRHEALIEVVAERTYGSGFSIGNDGHAVVLVKRWETPEGELVGAEELANRLLEVF